MRPLHFRARRPYIDSMTNTTNEMNLATLTNTQVRALRDEAGALCPPDARMVELCSIYLGEVEATDAEVVGAGMQIVEILRNAEAQS